MVRERGRKDVKVGRKGEREEGWQGREKGEREEGWEGRKKEREEGGERGKEVL